MFIGLNFGLTGEPVVVDAPHKAGPAEITLYKDFDLQVKKTTAATSRFVAAFRRCVNSDDPVVELDSVTGLLTVEGVTTPNPAAGSVTWESETIVAVHIDADAWDHLPPGLYWFDLTEITQEGLTILRATGEFYFVRSAGRQMGSG